MRLINTFVDLFPSPRSNSTGDPLHSRALAHSRAPLFTQPCPHCSHSRAPGEQWARLCVFTLQGCVQTARLCRGSPVNRLTCTKPQQNKKAFIVILILGMYFLFCSNVKYAQGTLLIDINYLHTRRPDQIKAVICWWTERPLIWFKWMNDGTNMCQYTGHWWLKQPMSISSSSSEHLTTRQLTHCGL